MIISDMDGVISDTQKAHSMVESALLREYGIDISPGEITDRFAGVSSKERFPILFKENGRICPDIRELGEEKYRRLAKIPDEEIIGIAGTLTMIRRWHAQGIKLAVGSASPPTFIERVLDVLAIRSCFKAIASSYEVPRGKPAPDVFLLAAKRLGVEPSSCIVIEDGVNGMIGANAAGMRCIALATDGRRDYPADLVVDDLCEVPEHFLEVPENLELAYA